MRFNKMITAVDAHAAGEPGRVIVGGVVGVVGSTMLEKQKYLEVQRDDIRKLMLQGSVWTCELQRSCGFYRTDIPSF